LDAADRVASVEVLYCNNDADARARAERMLTFSNHACIEVWDRTQIVYCARRPPAA
jgi:hypothetical protein